MNTIAQSVSISPIRSARALLALGLCVYTSLSWGAVQDLAGRYVGVWTNTTFGSTGKAVIEIQITGTNANLIFDMDGYVFGMMDPPVISMPGTISGEVILIDSKGVGMFGDIKGSVDALQKTLVATLTNIPGGYIQTVTNVGTISNGVIHLDYTVQFPGPATAQNPAHGVMTTTLVPPLFMTNVRRQAGDLLLTWTGGAAPFQVQTCTNLTVGGWQNIGLQTTLRSATVPLDASDVGFYRVTGQ